MLMTMSSDDLQVFAEYYIKLSNRYLTLILLLSKFDMNENNFEQMVGDDILNWKTT